MMQLEHNRAYLNMVTSEISVKCEFIAKQNEFDASKRFLVPNSSKQW